MSRKKEHFINISEVMDLINLCDPSIEIIAENFLQEFETIDSAANISSPSLVTVAVVIACNANGKEISQLLIGKLIKLCKMKKYKWSDLLERCRKLCGAETKTKDNSKIKRIIEEENVEYEEDYEDYDVWAKRILDDAYEQLELLEQKKQK